MNVLKSYKLDSGVDALLRENLSEVAIVNLLHAAIMS